MNDVDVNDEVFGGFNERYTQSLNPEITSEILNIRLNTENFLKENYLFLSAQYEAQETTENDDGELITETVLRQIKGAKPFLNPYGVRMVMGILREYVNPHTVQGNTERDELRLMTKYFSKRLIVFLVARKDKIGLLDRNIAILHQTLVNQVYLFLSRTVGNWERKFLTQGTEVKEGYTSQPKKKEGWLDKVFRR